MGGSQASKETEEDIEIEAEAKSLVEAEMSAAPNEGSEDESVDSTSPESPEVQSDRYLDPGPDSAPANLPANQVVVTKRDEYSWLRQLCEARVDDPQVIALAPDDPRLIVGKFQVREEVNDFDVDELRNSLIEDGQQKAIIAAKRGEELWIVSGNTRVIAARKKERKKKGQKQQPVNVEKVYVLPVDLTDEQARFLALWSNLDNRLPSAELTQDEEAAAIEKLITEHQWTQQKVAETLHRDQSWVSRRLKNLHIDPDIEKLVEAGDITKSHAEVITTLPKDLQEGLADDVSSLEWNVAQTQKAVSNIKVALKAGEGLPGDVIEDVVDAVKEQDIDAEGAKKLAESVKEVIKDTEDLKMESWERSQITEKVIEDKGDTEAAKDMVVALKSIASENLPKEVKDHLSSSVRRGDLKHEALGTGVIGGLKIILEDSDGLPRESRRQLWENVADQKIELATAQKLASSAKVFMEANKELPKDLLEQCVNKIVEKRYGAQLIKKLTDYMKAGVAAKKEEYTLRSAIWNEDWKKGLPEEKAKKEPKKYPVQITWEGRWRIIKLQCRECNSFIFVSPEEKLMWHEEHEEDD